MQLLYAHSRSMAFPEQMATKLKTAQQHYAGTLFYPFSPKSVQKWKLRVENYLPLQENYDRCSANCHKTTTDAQQTVTKLRQTPSKLSQIYDTRSANCHKTTTDAQQTVTKLRQMPSKLSQNNDRCQPTVAKLRQTPSKLTKLRHMPSQLSQNYDRCPANCHTSHACSAATVKEAPYRIWQKIRRFSRSYFVTDGRTDMASKKSFYYYCLKNA